MPPSAAAIQYPFVALSAAMPTTGAARLMLPVLPSKGAWP